MDGFLVNVGSGSQFIGFLSWWEGEGSGLAPVIPFASRELSGQFPLIGNVSS